ncbi:MAG TPA: LptE family protein [Candidatus Acidoferrales bacterium]|nr:LptE family protein [Candidatus Acidoferrales bacterium]
MARRTTEPRRAGSGIALLLAVLAAAAASVGCGYHVAGHGAQLPSEWKTIAIPAFKNDTTRYRIEQKVTQAVIREFISRTKYRVVQDTQSADAVLSGEVLSIETNPALFEATTGQVTTMLVTVHAKILLLDNKTQKPVYHNDDMVFRDEYQISSDVNTFFEEQDPALERMSRDLASHVVSDVLENF